MPETTFRTSSAGGRTPVPEWTPAWLRRLLRPREGWLAYVLLFIMLLSLGWAVQRAGWLEKADYLVPVALWASLLGAVLGLLPITVVATLPISALAGTAIVLWAVGGEYFPALSQSHRLLELRTEALGFAQTVSHLGYPTELTPYAIGLAMVMWVTAFIAAYTLYRHHRALDSILLVGAALIANMSATFLDLFGYLVLFVLAAMLLWLRTSLINREDGWRRRRVNENPDVPASIMRTGVVFIAVTIVLAWTLTSVAVAAPLTDAWRNLDGVWTGLRDRLDNVFGGLTNEESRIQGSSFGSRFTVSGSWFSNDAAVMTVSADSAYYMRTVSYDVYTGHGWSSSGLVDRAVPAKVDLFPNGTPEEPITKDGFDVKTVTISLTKPIGRNLFTPGFPLTVTAPAVVGQPKGEPFLGTLSSQNSIGAGEGYSVTTVISNVTEQQLRGAGTTYPASVTRLYLGLEGVTERTRALARQITSQATNPYDMAQALATYLRTNPNLAYATNVGKPPGDRDLVDFFLFDTQNGQRGYCEYFASAMAVMARSVGLPARVAVGFSPGQELAKNVYVYKEANAHAWTEIYFPGYGWQIFEATKSIDPKFVRLSGGDHPLPPPIGGVDPRGPFQQGVDDPSKIFTLPSTRPIGGGTVAGGSDTPASQGGVQGGNLIVVFAILLAVGGAIWWRLRRAGRRLRFLAPGDRQWALLLQAADRAGVRQRASETDFEYAGWLEEQIPARRPEIRTIADAKVFGSYSGHGMTADAVERMHNAWRRLRMPFAWLAVRRRARALLPRRGS
jgi:transglutaminase-like putative cysteine protease